MSNARTNTNPAHTDAEHRRGGFLRRRADRAKRYVTGHSLGYFAGLLCALLCGVVLVLPSPYVIQSPGPTQNVLGESDGTAVIRISGAQVYQGKGKLLLLTVSAEGVPGYPVTNAQALYGWFDPHRVVTPSEAVFPVGQSAEEYTQEAKGEMSDSQNTAVKAALGFATTLGIKVSGVKVTMHLDDIGGPSAGMMYALGILDELTERDETGGLTIAGTGTIDTEGKVGSIGGIRLKMLGARRDGATWFLAPRANCDEVVGHVPQGLRDVRVDTLDEAYQALTAIGRGEAESLPHCGT